jgi:hypothetical protein
VYKANSNKSSSVNSYKAPPVSSQLPNGPLPKSQVPLPKPNIPTTIHENPSVIPSSIDPNPSTTHPNHKPILSEPTFPSTQSSFTYISPPSSTNQITVSDKSNSLPKSSPNPPKPHTLPVDPSPSSGVLQSKKENKVKVSVETPLSNSDNTSGPSFTDSPVNIFPSSTTSDGTVSSAPDSAINLPSSEIPIASDKVHDSSDDVSDDPKHKSSERPKYSISKDSEDRNIILIRDPEVNPMECKYVSKPKKLPRSGKNKLFLDSKIDAGRMDIVGNCRLCNETISSCYADFHVLTCKSCDEVKLTDFYLEMAKLLSSGDNYDIESFALNYCLYELDTSDADVNEFFDLNNFKTFIAELEKFLDIRAACMLKKIGYTNQRRFNILKYP